MKKKILVAVILVCIFSHISAEGYISFGDLKKSSSGMVTLISRVCTSPEIKDIEVIKKRFYELSEARLREACKIQEQFANEYALTVVCTDCMLKDSSSETIYSIVATTLLGSTSVQVFKVSKDRSITLYNEDYNDFNVANAEYDRLCKKYIGML